MKKISFRISAAVCLMALMQISYSQPMPLPVQPQEAQNPNLVSSGYGAKLEASSVDRERPLRHMFDGRLTLRWETVEEKEGAWIKINWDKPQTVKELWIVNVPTPYDIRLSTESRSADFPAARKVKLDFSDGTSLMAELKQAHYYQIISLPQPKETESLKLTIESLWENSARQCTGLGKIKVFARNFKPDFQVHFFDMYEVRDGTPVKSAKIEIINPGETLKDARLRVLLNGKSFATLNLAEIPARSVSIQHLWIPAVDEPGKMTFTIQKSEKTTFTAVHTEVKPYRKDYFDGGVFQILNTNHNDLGFLNTQFVTADYRSNEEIAPALDLMRDHPDYTYHMESVEYLKEFLVRFPERRDEIALRMREGRFQFGAGYVQNLQVHVGREKLVRQFYYGRRWLLENFPGADTRFYSNVDVPGMTYQLPQILKKSGVDYMLQGRFPWGFYYWEGLDGSSIPVFALRYTPGRMLLNPVDNSGWLHFQNIREPYYRKHNLPKQLIYDFNCDYLVPALEMIPFVTSQNKAMKEFATVWNNRFKSDPDKQIQPPRLEF